MCTTDTTISAAKCKIIRHCDRNGFIYNFIKNIHIVEHKPTVQMVKNIYLLALIKLHLNRIIPVQTESTWALHNY